MCSCPSNIVTIDQPKDTKKYIADDEAVRSNIKLLLHPEVSSVTGASARAYSEDLLHCYFLMGSNCPCTAARACASCSVLLLTVTKDNPDIGYLRIFGPTLLDEPEIGRLCFVCLTHSIMYVP